MGVAIAIKFQTFHIRKTKYNSLLIQRVTEISTLILTGNRTRQKEQLFFTILPKNDV
jgi:hypothetical protein